MKIFGLGWVKLEQLLSPLHFEIMRTFLRVKYLVMSENTKSQPKILLTPFVYTTTHCQKRFKIKHYQQSEYASDGA